MRPPSYPPALAACPDPAASSDPVTRVPDLRLIPLAVGCWAAALAALNTGATTATVLAATALASVVVLHTVRPRGGARWRRITAAALLGVVCGGSAAGAQLWVRDFPEISELAAEGASALAELTVSDDPRPAGGGAGKPTWVVPARLHGVQGRPVPGVRVLVLAADPSWSQLVPGQRLAVQARFSRSRGGDLRAAVLSATGRPRLLGRPPWYQQAAAELRAGLQRACEPLDDRPGGLLPGLVVGDVNRLDPAVEQQFRDAGLTHLTAVSGSNVALIVSMVLMLTRWAGAGPRLSTVLCVVAVVGFVILVRPSPSVLRAAVMGGVGLLALAGGRPRAALPALAGTVVGLLIVDPELAGSAGFALSVLATGGLLLLAPVLRDAMRRRGVPHVVAEALAVPLAAQLATAPVVAGLSGSISLVAVPANLLVVPAIAPATLTGVAAAAISPLWPDAAEFAAWLGGWPAWWLVKVAEQASTVPGGMLPWPDGTPGALLLAGLTVLLMTGFRKRLVRRLTLVITLAVTVGALPVRLLAPGWPAAGWLIVACDVGQGDAIVLRAGPRAAVVVDAGPQPSAVDGCLTRLRIEVVPLMLVSHFHVDHIGGLSGVLRGRQVRQIVTTGWPEPAAGRDAVHRQAEQSGVPVAAAGRSSSWKIDELSITVLPSEPLRGTRSDPNNNSLLIMAVAGGIRLLLTGDAEAEQQRALLGAGIDVTASVLKIAHHGSAFQDSAFLDTVRPSVALVCVGAGNRYGHPNGSVLSRLAAGGARIVRTDQSGDIAVVAGPDGRPAVVVRGR